MHNVFEFGDEVETLNVEPSTPRKGTLASFRPAKLDVVRRWDGSTVKSQGGTGTEGVRSGTEVNDGTKSWAYPRAPQSPQTAPVKLGHSPWTTTAGRPSSRRLGDRKQTPQVLGSLNASMTKRTSRSPSMHSSTSLPKSELISPKTAKTPKTPRIALSGYSSAPVPSSGAVEISCFDSPKTPRSRRRTSRHCLAETIKVVEEMTPSRGEEGDTVKDLFSPPLPALVQRHCSRGAQRLRRDAEARNSVEDSGVRSTCSCCSKEEVWAAVDLFMAATSKSSEALNSQCLFEALATPPGRKGWDIIQSMKRSNLDGKVFGSKKAISLEEYVKLIWPQATREDTKVMGKWSRFRRANMAWHVAADLSDNAPKTEDLRKAFDLIDQNGDGTLTVEELDKAEILTKEELSSLMHGAEMRRRSGLGLDVGAEAEEAAMSVVERLFSQPHMAFEDFCAVAELRTAVRRASAITF